MSMNKSMVEIVESMYGIQLIKAQRKLSAMHISKERADFLHGNPDDLIYEIETKYLDVFGRTAILEYVTYLTTKMDFTIEINRK